MAPETGKIQYEFFARQARRPLELQEEQVINGVFLSSQNQCPSPDNGQLVTFELSDCLTMALSQSQLMCPKAYWAWQLLPARPSARLPAKLVVLINNSRRDYVRMFYRALLFY